MYFAALLLIIILFSTLMGGAVMILVQKRAARLREISLQEKMNREFKLEKSAMERDFERTTQSD